jgi:hypothetical protein
MRRDKGRRIGSGRRGVVFIDDERVVRSRYVVVEGCHRFCKKWVEVERKRELVSGWRRRSMV